MVKEFLFTIKTNICNVIKSKSKFAFFLYAITIILFGLIFFSIPALSFRTSLNLITWVLTFLFIFVSLIYLIFLSGIKIDIILLSLFGFCVSCFISSLLNGMKGFVFTPIFLTAFSGLFYVFLKSSGLPKKPYFIAAYLGLIVFNLLFIIEYRTELLSFNFTRLGESFGDENDIALFFALTFLFSIISIFFNKKILFKLINLPIVLMSGYCGLSTGSKAFILLVCVVLMFSILLFFGKKRWYFSLITFLAIIIAIVVLLSLPPFETLRYRILQMLSTFTGKHIDGVYGVDLSSIDRLRMFYDGFEMFLRKPLFGFGIQGFFTFSSYGGMWSHNNFSESLCNFGLVGSILFHFPFFYSVFKNHKEQTPIKLYSYFLTLFFITSMFVVALNSQKIFTFLIPLVYFSGQDSKDIFYWRIFKK
jgi:O-antigen ligase